MSPSETHWVVYQLAPRIKNGKPLDIEQARKDASFVQESGILEDRHAAREIQAGLASGANTHFTFGHYEQAIGHFHRHLTEHVEMLKASRIPLPDRRRTIRRWPPPMAAGSGIA